jgi:hypothetical protein
MKRGWHGAGGGENIDLHGAVDSEIIDLVRI